MAIDGTQSELFSDAAETLGMENVSLLAGVVGKLTANHSRAAYVEGLRELLNMHVYPTPYAVQQASECFISAAYACNSVAEWTWVLSSAARVMAGQAGPFAPEVNDELLGCAAQLGELQKAFAPSPNLRKH